MMTVKNGVLAIVLSMSSYAIADPVTYVIDKLHTFPSFSYSHLGYSIQTSRFNKTSGTVIYDSAKQEASVDVTIDMKSVDAGSILTDHIQGKDFLDTATFPVATFKSQRVYFADGKPSTIDGLLTIKGVTKPVVLQVTAFQHAEHPMLHKPAIGANAVTHIKRSEFNAGAYVPNVGDDVTINLTIEAVQQ